MDTNISNGNSGGNAVGIQTGTTGSDPDELNDALGRLQATVSDFVQEFQASVEGHIARDNQMSQQLRANDSKLERNAAQIERLSSWIENNRR
jgi:ABC-type transporter Mla subunit MlaD